MRNAVVGLPGVRGIAKAVFVDHFRSQITQQRKSERAAAVGGDFVSERAAVVRAITADRVEANIGIRVDDIAQCDQLSHAIRSPVATVKHDDRFVAARIGEMHGMAVLIRESEVGRDLSDRESEEESGDHEPSVS